MFAIHSETIELAGIVAVLFVTAGIALWMRDYRRSDNASPVTLSEEARSSLLRAREASIRKAAEEQKAARKLAKVAHRQAFRRGGRPEP